MFKNIQQNALFKVLSMNSISVMVSFVLGLFSSKIIAVFLGSSGMAMMGSFRNFTSMLKSMATLGINNSVVKLFVENKDDERELSVIYSTFFWLFLILSTVIALLVLVFSTTISAFIFFKESYTFPIQLFALLLPLIVINVFWTAIYNGLKQFKRIVVIQIISSILVFGATSILIWKHQLTGGLVSLAIGEFLMVIITFLYIKRDRSLFRFELQKVISKPHIKVIQKFSIMALLTAVIAPLTLILIRNTIVANYSLKEAGIWDATNRLSSFYMLFFSSGLSLYYMPKLASLKTDAEFKSELKEYFKWLVPLFIILIVLVFVMKEFILKIAFTSEFDSVKNLLIWQLLGDLIRIMSLAFGFQIVVKTMMKRYFFIEIIFNLTYLLLSFYLIKIFAEEGALQAYFYANVVSLLSMIFMFRKVIFGK